MIAISGKVIHGEHLGKKLGFPTANLDRREYVHKKMRVKLGVWAGRAEISKSKFYKAGIVIGPIGSSGLPKIEAHLIGFKGNLYGRYLNIYLYRYLRPFKKFSSEVDLKKQIARDIQRIREIEK